MIVKIPVTSAGIPAIEEATYRGISINATVSFTLPQCDRRCRSRRTRSAPPRGRRQRHRHHGAGLHDHGRPPRRLAEGREEKEDVSTDPGYLEWAGVAVFKKTYAIFRERGYRMRLLSAAFRNHMHWSEFIGGDVVISRRAPGRSATTPATSKSISRIDTPVDRASSTTC